MVRCEKHDEEMIAVSWMMRKGVAYSTAYMCKSCTQERGEGDPIKLFEGSVDHSRDEPEEEG